MASAGVVLGHENARRGFLERGETSGAGGGEEGQERALFRRGPGSGSAGEHRLNRPGVAGSRPASCAVFSRESEIGAGSGAAGPHREAQGEGVLWLQDRAASGVLLQ